MRAGTVDRVGGTERQPRGDYAAESAVASVESTGADAPPP